MFKFKLFFLCFVLLFSPSLYAREKKLFIASYLNFYIEGDWTCKAFYIEWVCHHRFSDSVYPVFMLIGAEEAKTWNIFNFFWKLFKAYIRSDLLLNNSYPRILRVDQSDWIEDFRRGKFPLDLYHQWKVTAVCCEEGSERARVSVSFYATTENFSKYLGLFSKAINSIQLGKSIKRPTKGWQESGIHHPEIVDHIQQILSTQKVKYF